VKSILLAAAISWFLVSAAAPAMACGSMGGLPCAVTVSCSAPLNCSTADEARAALPSLQTGRQAAWAHEHPRKEHIPLPDFPPPKRTA
jgi:hypothetical protein